MKIIKILFKYFLFLIKLKIMKTKNDIIRLKKEIQILKQKNNNITNKSIDIFQNNKKFNNNIKNKKNIYNSNNSSLSSFNYDLLELNNKTNTASPFKESSKNSLILNNSHNITPKTPFQSSSSSLNLNKFKITSTNFSNNKNYDLNNNNNYKHNNQKNNNVFFNPKNKSYVPRNNSVGMKNPSSSFSLTSNISSIHSTYNNNKNPLNSITKFINNMNENTQDKIEMIKYLSIPQYMNMIIGNNKIKFLFILVPNKISYLNGIESYVFQWMDIHNKKFVGGFDLIKVNSCIINNINPNNFLLETFDGNKIRQYELNAESLEKCSYNVKCINYLSQLEKCKLFNTGFK